MSACLKEAERLTAGAERARQEGDTAASIVLATWAAQLLRIDRLLSPAPSGEPGAQAERRQS
ncbi:MAG: hypothetical protein AAFW01_00105 [Pseudomonadota bacterium]